jgi:16S rRNA U516 pseudouridylate synthase RsuA-like enzyme
MTASNQDILVRLQKVIADCGVTSRRKAEGYILDGRVEVNGRVVTELGTKVNPHTDIIQVDGNTLELMAVDKVYLVMNKPRAYMTTVSDPEGRPTVMDLIYGVKQRIFPVGRLDYLSEGLLMLLNRLVLGSSFLVFVSENVCFNVLLFLLRNPYVFFDVINGFPFGKQSR